MKRRKTTDLWVKILFLTIAISLSIFGCFQTNDLASQMARIHEVKTYDEDHSRGERRGFNLNNSTRPLPPTFDSYAFDTTNPPAIFEPGGVEIMSGGYPFKARKSSLNFNIKL